MENRAFNLDSFLSGGLSSRVAVYVPMIPGSGDRASDSIAALLSDLFGGATSENVRGYWVSRDGGGLMVDKIRRVWAACSADSLSDSLPVVVAAAADLAGLLHQEAITVEVDGVLRFVDARGVLID